MLRSTIIARKKKGNIGNTQYRGKGRQQRETMPVLLYIYTHISHEWHGTPGALTICTENPVIPGRIQMERFIPVECFRKKR